METRERGSDGGDLAEVIVRLAAKVQERTAALIANKYGSFAPLALCMAPGKLFVSASVECNVATGTDVENTLES